MVISTKLSIDEMISILPKPEQVIVRRLRALAQECLPRAEEQKMYGFPVPLFRHNRMICFIWPGSVSWGPKRPADSPHASSIALGFCQGNLMSNENKLLHSEGRKQVYCMYFNSISDVDEELLRALLFEAELIDDSFSKKKKRKLKQD